MTYKMVSTDNHKPCILSSSTSIRLQRKRIKSSDYTQKLTQVFEQFLINQKNLEKTISTIGDEKKCYYLISLSLVSWGKWVKICKAGPSNRHHFHSSIQFHCAWSKRNHAVAQWEILWLQLVHVAQKLMFCVVAGGKRKEMICTLSMATQFVICRKFKSHTNWRLDVLNMGSLWLGFLGLASAPQEL